MAYKGAKISVLTPDRVRKYLDRKILSNCKFTLLNYNRGHETFQDCTIGRCATSKALLDI